MSGCARQQKRVNLSGNIRAIEKCYKMAPWMWKQYVLNLKHVKLNNLAQITIFIMCGPRGFNVNLAPIIGEIKY